MLRDKLRVSRSDRALLHGGSAPSERSRDAPDPLSSNEFTQDSPDRYDSTPSQRRQQLRHFGDYGMIQE
jgi:hypothetical protein